MEYGQFSKPFPGQFPSFKSLSRAGEGGAQREKETSLVPNKLFHPSLTQGEPGASPAPGRYAQRQSAGSDSPGCSAAARAGQGETATGSQGGPGASGGEAAAQPEDQS